MRIQNCVVKNVKSCIDSYEQIGGGRLVLRWSCVKVEDLTITDRLIRLLNTAVVVYRRSHAMLMLLSWSLRCSSECVARCHCWHVSSRGVSSISQRVSFMSGHHLSHGTDISRFFNQANWAFHHFGVDWWVVSGNWMTLASVRGGAVS